MIRRWGGEIDRAEGSDGAVRRYEVEVLPRGQPRITFAPDGFREANILVQVSPGSPRIPPATLQRDRGFCVQGPPTMRVLPPATGANAGLCGRVEEPGIGYIAGASVSASPLDGGPTITTTTDSEGRFTLLRSS